MQVAFHGVRGSTPAPGAAFVRYGGNTSCVSIAHDGQDPTLVLDGGTGLRALTTALEGRPFDGTILIGHLHWDHTHGLPFFRGGDCDQGAVRVLIPEQGDPEALMDRFMSPPHFPVRLTDLRGNWTVGSLEAGEHKLEGFSVLAVEIPHKASRTFGFRVSDGQHTIAYLSDHMPTAEGPGPDGIGPYHDAAVTLARGADVLIHDAQYTAEEIPTRGYFGHAAAEYAVGLGVECGVGTVVLFHHDPDRTDDEIDAIVATQKSAPINVVGATETLTISL